MDPYTGTVLIAEDEADKKLQNLVHPTDWQNPEPKRKYDLLVIGAGSAGLVSASIAAGLGASVALVERHLLGGDCLNAGCVPSKAIIRSANACKDVLRAKEYGIQGLGAPTADFPKIMLRMRQLRAEIGKNDSVKRFTDMGADVFLGKAVFLGPQTLEVEGKQVHFKKAILATGARAAHPEIPGLKEAGFHTNETVFSLTKLPKRLVIIGGGPIGCELAQAFARFGSEVTILDRSKQLLPREDSEAAKIVHQSFLDDGII